MEFALANGITHSPSGELPRNRIIQQKIPNCNALLRKSSCIFAQDDEACFQFAEEVSRKVRKVCKVMIGITLAAEASERF